MRRRDAGILDESLFGRLTHLFSNILLVVWEVGSLNCIRKQQNWGEFNVRCMVDVKIPSRIGANRRVLALKRDILTLSHNTIDIALVRTDGGRVWVVAGGHVVTILSMGTRIRENGRCQRRSVAVNKDSWRRSGRSCYEWQADLLGRCWVRLHCNGGFKGWCTTLIHGRFVWCRLRHGLCDDLREGLLVALNCQNCFFPTFIYTISLAQ